MGEEEQTVYREKVQEVYRSEEHSRHRRKKNNERNERRESCDLRITALTGLESKPERVSAHLRFAAWKSLEEQGTDLNLKLWLQNWSRGGPKLQLLPWEEVIVPSG